VSLGIAGKGFRDFSEKASHSTVHHCFVVLANFFGWVVREGFLPESPIAKIKVANLRTSNRTQTF